MSGWTAQDIPDQQGRVIIITGANSGVGYESAVALAQKGAQIVMACRSMDKAEKAHQDLLKRAPNANVDVQPLDLGNLASVRSFADSFKSRYSRLDVLMNNAGIMIPPYAKTANGFESQFGTNHLGHFALTGLLLPKLIETPASRVVTVSSGVYLFGRINFDDLQSEKKYSAQAAYAQSKLANLLFMEEFKHKLDAAHADVLSVASHPGYSITNLQVHQSGLMTTAFGDVFRHFMSQPAEPGARYQLYAATMPDVRSGEYFGPSRFLVGDVTRNGLTARAKDPAVAARLWQVSEQLTGVHFEVSGQPAPAYA